MVVDRAAEFTGTQEVREQHRFEVGRLQEYMQDNTTCFAVKGGLGGDMLRFVGVSLGFRVGKYLSFLLLQNVFQIVYFVALVIVLVVSIILKFFTYRQFVFNPQGMDDFDGTRQTDASGS